METAQQENIGQQNIVRIFQLFIGVVGVLIFLPYLKWLVASWAYNPLDTFGYLAPFVSIWAINKKKNEIRTASASNDPRGWIHFISGLFLSLLFHWSGQAVTACIGMPLFLYGLSLIIWGKERSRYLVFPIFFLLFLYPWGDLLDFLVGYELRRLSVLLSYLFMKVIGLDAAVSGTYLFTGRFLVDIAPACSGITIMNVLLFLGAIGVYIYRGAVGSKIIIFISIIPLAILLNAIRIICTGLIGHYYGDEVAIGFYDNLSGMLVFGIAMLVLYGEGLILKGVFKK